ncbi:MULTISPECIES: hypothetical protein [Sphingobium]|jgi:hypothetical protein|uniref:Secreted protein n=1 Tax=Sphingobium tyrosinilyticum TaxID=2715436 RepID=A0ABV9ETF8_9SPHN|nr:hypothetical protein [Sphingobium sp. EP60837]ANI78439.1 hypothetical protein EP837_02031 [Sphingobium sp. EP60837]
MRGNARMIFTALLLAGCAALAGCGKDDKSSNAVQMKDLEVVDGTTTDAMTDLDGVQSEVPAASLPSAGGNNSAAAAPKPEPAANATPGETEVLSDQ